MKGACAKSMSVRAKINNFAKAGGISPQHALQAFFAERFLARIERSRYVKNLVIKGGTLVSSILGVTRRTTMDIDATVIGMRVDGETVRKIVSEVAATDAGDGIRFDVDRASPDAIVKDDDYGGFSLRLVASFGTIRLPMGIDLTFGDVITPKAERRAFPPILDGTAAISVYAYTVETLIAEKLQTVLSRGEANTRPRDFYDLYMLGERVEYDADLLRQSVTNTFGNRHSEGLLDTWETVLDSVADSVALHRQWERYRASASYAQPISFDATVTAVRNLLETATAPSKSD